MGCSPEPELLYEVNGTSVFVQLVPRDIIYDPAGSHIATTPVKTLKARDGNTLARAEYLARLEQARNRRPTEPTSQQPSKRKISPAATHRPSPRAKVQMQTPGNRDRECRNREPPQISRWLHAGMVVAEGPTLAECPVLEIHEALMPYSPVGYLFEGRYVPKWARNVDDAVERGRPWRR